MKVCAARDVRRSIERSLARGYVETFNFELQGKSREQIPFMA